MSHRTQIILSDAQYARLKRESERTGVGLAELIRRAVSATYGSAGDSGRAGLEAGFGAWRDRDFDGEEYVDALRRPGLGHRLGR